MRYRIINTILFGIAFLIFGACEDLIQVENPRTRLIKRKVFDDERTATAAVAGLYNGLTSYSGGFNSIMYLAALSADEATISGEVEAREFYNNQILTTNTNIGMLWRAAYAELYKANTIMEGLANSLLLKTPIKNQLTGEARFFRAFHHFYLVNIFGAIPYITSTDYRANGLSHRMSAADVYQQIITDLLEAKALLVEDYSNWENERVRVNRWAATALLARAYLFRQEWTLAEEQASILISKTALYALNDLDKVFLKNSTETIWQLMPPYQLLYTAEGGILIRPIYSPNFATMSDHLFLSFESGDGRLSEWTRTASNGDLEWHYGVKYKENSSNATGREYSTVLRLAEQYLIRAEARAHQNKLVEAQRDLDAIRQRAGLPRSTASTKDEILVAIAQERRVELFLEWGHRWLDLKRTGKASSVLTLIKPLWNETDTLYPIPFAECQLNPNLTQNPGY